MFELEEFIGHQGEYFERKIFWRGPKRYSQVPPHFEAAWEEYKNEWSYAVSNAKVEAFFLETYGGLPVAISSEFNFIDLETPNYKEESHFDPMVHNGGAALHLGIDYLSSELFAYGEEVQSGKYSDYAFVVANKCRIALEAFDYLENVIGINLDEVYRRWRDVPTVFMPSVVSDKYGRERGSLNHLLDNAIRAYVCGAPAAAIAMCRSVLEMVVKDHYITDSKDRIWTDKSGNEREKGLGDLIVLAEKRYQSLRPLKLVGLKNAGDEILHRYSRREPLSASDEAAIIDYMRTLKTLIQKVEG